MPITITPLPPDGRVGYGLPLRVQSDFVGPLGVGASWHVVVSTDAEGVDLVYGEFFLASTVGPVDLTLFSPTTTGWQGPVQLPAPEAPVHITAELTDGSSTVDSGATTGTWDPVSGIAINQKAYATAGIGAFTSADRATLQASLASTSVAVPASGGIGGSVLRGLGELLTGIPPQFGNRHGSILVSGQGSLSRGVDPYRADALGIEWHWHTIPPGFGRTLGSVDEMGRRIVQWRFIDQDDSGQLYQWGWVDSRHDGERYMWGVHSPVTLEWYVAPGCIVELSFMVLLLG